MAGDLSRPFASRATTDGGNNVKTGKSMRELSESGELKTFLDPRLIKALGHPVREHILAVLNERVASGKEIGDEIGADVSAFYHHLKELEKLGCIKRVDTRQRRGCWEHRFKATRTVFFDAAAWEKLPASVRADLTACFVQGMFDAVVAALAEETYGNKDDDVTCSSSLNLDEIGWNEFRGLLEHTVRTVMKIQSGSSDRISEGAAAVKLVTLGMLAFESPRQPG